MCCETMGQHGKKPEHGMSCGCSGHTGPMFWSKKKKLKMLEHKLECLQEQSKDIKELIAELNAEK